MINFLKHLDTEIFIRINSVHSDFFDKIMLLISGQILWLPYFALIIYLFFKKDKKIAVFGIILLIITIILSDFISVHAFKDVFKRLRPCHNPDIKNVVHIVNAHCGGNYGFVSSHAANFFSLAIFSSLNIRKKYFTIAAFFIAVIVSYSRIYLGVHYPADVICGGILGVIIGFIFWKIYNIILLKIR